MIDIVMSYVIMIMNRIRHMKCGSKYADVEIRPTRHDLIDLFIVECM